jgi:hypothetical protein
VRRRSPVTASASEVQARPGHASGTAFFVG